MEIRPNLLMSQSLNLSMQSDGRAWLEGLLSIEAAVAAQNRDIEGIFIRRTQKRKYDRRLARLQQTAVKASIAVDWVDDAFIEARVSGQSHGGVIAAVGPRYFVGLDDLVRGTVRPFIVMLDGVEDPFNFGQAVRALYAAGVTGIVLRPRNWLSAAGTVARASAGATELMPFAVADTAVEAADHLRQRELTIACTSRQKAISIYDADLTGPLFMLLGGEKRGITRSFMDQADIRLQIPYQRSQFSPSLGVTASAAILGFEVMRQRQS
ncbi:MAG: RNA methyltransferase [Chloroflexi bacterium]|nr:RNA methyltransferase [Chloroflexota bacterium]